MIIIDKATGAKYRATKTKRPSFKCCFGRTWDVWIRDLILDDNKVELHYDSTWGGYFYFQHDDSWFKIKMSYDSVEMLKHPGDEDFVNLVDGNKKFEVKL